MARSGRRRRAGAVALLALALCGCGGSTHSLRASLDRQRTALRAYLAAIEPIRLAVNRLLEGADPILSAYTDWHLSPRAASQRMGSLERQFAAYSVGVAALEPRTPRLASLQALYAHTYVLEDSYLSALTTGLGEHDLNGLPDTQSEQRADIIEWRIGLEVLSRRLMVALPGDLQAAGRGEIAPSPDGS
jgi:hypothetical protein